MPFYGFQGGVHPSYNKTATQDKKIERLAVKEGQNVFIPLSQHIGAPAKPLVKKKDRVQAGQIIASAAGFISTNIHSSVDGEVVAIGSVPHPIAGKIEGITIKADGEPEDYLRLEPKAKFQETVLSAGISGLGGATFPSHVKLSPPKKVDTLIINGAECEPYLTCDHRIMLERTEAVLKGAKIIREKLKIDKLYVGIEENKPDAIEAFEKYSKEYEFELVPLEVKYPQGGEKQLIKAIVDRVVPEGKLPLEVGCIVHNVSTCVAVYEAVEEHMPLIERPVTITGAVNEPKNVRVRIGVTVRELIEAAGGFKGEPVKIIMGGPMMGFAITSLDTPVMKGTSGIIVFTESDLPDLKRTNCIRCGRCIGACPMGLNPAMMDRFVVKELYEELADWHVLNCIECGCCSYVCPARRNLASGFKTSKRQVMQVMKKREADND